MKKQDTMRKMYDILEFIKKYTSENSYPPSVREICMATSIKSTATVYYYLNLLEQNNLIRRAQAKNRAIEVINEYSDNFPKKKLVDIPLVGKIAAGEPILAIQNLDDVYTLPANLFDSSEDLFMLRVLGDSMIEAGIFDSDIIVIRRQPTAENGQIAVALLDGSATVKRFFKEKDRYRLHPENQSMEDIIVKEVEILGVVVGSIRQF